MAEAFIKLVSTTKQGPMGTIVETRDIYLELGRRIKFPLTRRAPPSQRQIHEIALNGQDVASVFPKKLPVLQATIRDIRIAPKRQKQGLFTALVKYLLERDGAVHLEAVQHEWLKRRLAKSPLWVCQSILEGHDDPGDEFNPCYARFEMNEPFTLF